MNKSNIKQGFDVRLELGSLGIISGEEKRVLECYIDPRDFKQRKTYDEYTITSTNCIAPLHIADLMILGEHFRILVIKDCVIISDKD